MGSSKTCMNTSCGAKTTVQWKKAWELKSGETADLCYKCGRTYDDMVYCETFHAEETGWRECKLCNKRLHCGCIASVSLIVIQDFGGVWCTNCAKSADCHPPIRDRVSSEPQASMQYNNASDVQNSQFTNNLETNAISNGNLLSFGNFIETNVHSYLPHSPPEFPNGSFEQITPEATKSLVGVGGLGFSNLCHDLNGPTLYAQPNEDNSNSGVKDMQEIKMPSLKISLSPPPETPTIGLNFSSGIEEEENTKSTAFQSGQRPRKILPKPPKQNVAKTPDVNKNTFSPMRVPRPPAEGKLKSQLLQRYWPKITDEELQKLSGDLNSKIVPLFEKILSSSDASRIGRLVLPKACAEAYFPTINQSEGVPLKVQDIKGNNWTFQFRFWPNNNSRMYVLEGIMPCIQAMQVQAGDTVTFSRIDPGGKLVIGYRKASNTEVQDPETSSANPNGVAAGDNCNPDVADSLFIKGDQFGPQSTGGVNEDQPSVVAEQSYLVNGNSSWDKSEKLKGKVNEDVLEQPKHPSNKKRVRNISSKSKRLHMHDDDAMKLRLTCAESQDLLRPQSSVCANIVVIDDYEFEEYDEPPVLGKKTVFTTPPSGEQQQWAQCDKCSKWRKIPSDVYLPPKWTCSENVWDLTRSSCSSLQEETNVKEPDDAIRGGKDSKKRKVAESPKQGCEPSGLDALATAATLGDHEEPSAGATTRHPRHRPGCTCIVCIQPPSGKGKHKPTCACNVCLTVKRRFKTLMSRKKKRQCEKEAAEMALQNSNEQQAKESELSKQAMANVTRSNKDHVNGQPCQEIIQLSEGESSSSKGHIDLNSDPIREEDATLDGQTSMGIMALAQAATAPFDMYMKPNGLANLLHPQPMDTDSSLLQKACDYVDRLLPNEERHASVTREQQPRKANGKSSNKPAGN